MLVRIADLADAAALLDLVRDVENGTDWLLHEVDVITSYSIHYTKLYERWKPGGAEGRESADLAGSFAFAGGTRLSVVFGVEFLTDGAFVYLVAADVAAPAVCTTETVETGLESVQYGVPAIFTAHGLENRHPQPPVEQGNNRPLFAEYHYASILSK